MNGEHKAPHRIEVLGEHEEEQPANAVDLYITIEGSSFFTGRAALSKAKELSSLVDALSQGNITQDCIDILSVNVSVQSGVFSKSSSATYQLRVRVKELDTLGHALGAVTAAKQARLDNMEWQYPNDADTEARLLAAAAKQGAVKARAIAAALDKSLGALLSAVERTAHVEPYMEHATVAFGAPRARMAAPAEMGVQVQHRRKAKREIALTFEVKAP